LSLYFGDVLAAARKVDSWSTWHSLYQGLEWRKFAIGVHGPDLKSTVEIELVYLFKSFIDVLDLPIGQVVDCSETDLSTECNKKRNLVHKENVTRQEYILVEL
jgi:hypothetical protein